MKGILVLVAFLAGAGLTWLLTVHRVTRESPVGGPATGDEPTPDDVASASGFGGSRSGESSGAAGARWMSDAEDEDALLPDAEASDARRGTPPPT